MPVGFGVITSNREYFHSHPVLRVSDIWIMEICYYLGPVIRAEQESERHPLRCFFLDWSSFQGNLWIHLSFFWWRLAVLLMRHYGRCILYPLALNVYWWGGRRGGWTVKTVCMSIVFSKAVRLNVISIMYSMWGWSWTHGIGTLKRFKEKRKMGRLFSFLKCWY